MLRERSGEKKKRKENVKKKKKKKEAWKNRRITVQMCLEADGRCPL